MGYQFPNPIRRNRFSRRVKLQINESQNSTQNGAHKFLAPAGASRVLGMARCTLCVCDFSVASGGRTNVRRHVKTARHQTISKTMVATKGGVRQYVAKGNDAIDGVTMAETMVTYWLTYHNLPMSAEFSRMVSALFPDSNIARTCSSGKCYKTICNNLLSLRQICYIVIVTV